MVAIGDDHTLWESKGMEVQHGINGTIHATTGYAPVDLLYGYRPRLRFHISVNNDNTQKGRLEQVKKID